MQRVRVPLPPGMSPGAVIGKGGETVRRLQSRSGARVNVNGDRGEVEISGSGAQVQAAHEMLLQVIGSYKATGGAYPHPLVVFYVLGPTYGTNDMGEVAFIARDDEVTRATDRSEQMYALVPAADGGPRGGHDPADELAAMMRGGLALGQGGRLDPVLFKDRASVLQHAVAAVERAAGYEPRFDDVKIRFNFGAALFYKGPVHGQALTIRELKGRRIPRDLKAVFSNGVAGRARAALLELLTRDLGFELAERKETMSMHLQELGRSASHALSLVKGADGAVSLRKVKSASNKLAFLTVLSGEMGGPDWRAKVLAHYQPSSSGPPLEQIAASAKLVGGGPGGAGGPRVQLASLGAYDLRVDRERHKSKCVYAGKYKGLGVKVTFSSVWSADKGTTHNEVAGTSPELNTLVSSALAAGRLLPADAERLERGLDTLMGLALRAAEAVAAAAAATAGM